MICIKFRLMWYHWLPGKECIMSSKRSLNISPWWRKFFVLLFFFILSSCIHLQIAWSPQARWSHLHFQARLANIMKEIILFYTIKVPSKSCDLFNLNSRDSMDIGFIASNHYIHHLKFISISHHGMFRQEMSIINIGMNALECMPNSIGMHFRIFNILCAIFMDWNHRHQFSYHFDLFIQTSE